MTTPYASRLVASIGGTDIELARFRRAPCGVLIRQMTRHLSCEWRQERTTPNRNTLTPRWEPDARTPEAMRLRAENARACS